MSEKNKARAVCFAILVGGLIGGWAGLRLANDPMIGVLGLCLGSLFVMLLLLDASSG